MGSDADGQFEERASGNVGVTWLLLKAERRVLAVVLLVVFYLFLLSLIVVWPSSLRGVLTDRQPVTSLFNALIMAVVTAVTLVVTINQVVLSQELGAVNDQYDRMKGAVAFRGEVTEYIDAAASPAEPAAFLQSLITASRDAAEHLNATLSTHADQDLRNAADTYTTDLIQNAEAVASRMDDAQFGTYQLIDAALDYNYSWKLYRAEALRNAYVDSLSADERRAFEDLIDILQLYGPAREHFKTLYFQWELTDFSRDMLYTALPALAVSVTALLFVDSPETLTGSVAGIDITVFVLVSAVTIAIIPFALMISYILRIATVTKRTLAMGPFILRADERTGDDSPPQP